MRTMKAIVYEKAGRKNAFIRSIPYPVCGADQVVMRVVSCGICKGVDTEHDKNGTELARYPVVPGHEFSGDVAEVGANVTDLAVGDRIVGDNTILCGHCYYCQRDLPNYCLNLRSIGHSVNGGFAEYVLLDREKVFRIPDGVSYDAACLAEPVACCINAMDRLQTRYGDTVAVFGAGPNGMILAQLLQRSNASRVIVLAPTQSKLDVLESMGIETLRMDRSDPERHEARLRELFPYGLDAVVDATGSGTVISRGFRLLKKGGRLLQYSAGVGQRVEIDAFSFFVNELQYLTACCQTHKFPRAIHALADGTINAERMITHHFALDDYFAALDLNVQDPSAIKVVIHP